MWYNNVCLQALLAHTHLTFEIAARKFRLLYVAITRARKYLVLSPTMVKVLSEAKENFFQPVLIQETKIVRTNTSSHLI